MSLRRPLFNHVLAALLMLACAATAIAADTAPLQTFHADYQVLRSGKELGHATLSLRALDGDTWEFSSQTHGTAGMASLLGLDVVEKSTFRWNAGHPQGLHYHYVQKSAIKSRDTAIDFDWPAKTATTHDNGKTRNLALDAPAMDRNLITPALMADLKSGAADFNFHIVDKDKVSDQHYLQVGHETMTLPAGNIDAVKIERDRGDSKRRTTSWFAPQRGFLPVQIEQVEKNGETITMRLLPTQGR